MDIKERLEQTKKQILEIWKDEEERLKSDNGNDRRALVLSDKGTL
jgi:hypothetical protein